MTPWTVAYQAPLSMKFPRRECWSRLLFPSPGEIPDPGMEPVSPALAGRFFTTEPPRKPCLHTYYIFFRTVWNTMPLYMCHWVFPKNKNFFFINHSMIIKGFPGDSDGEESTCNAGDLGSLPGLGRSPGGGHGNPLQYSCLENPMDRGAWWATFHGVSKSWTQLNN